MSSVFTLNFMSCDICNYGDDEQFCIPHQPLLYVSHFLFGDWPPDNDVEKFFMQANEPI